MSRRLDPADRPLDRLLVRLIVYRLPHREDLTRFDAIESVCPICSFGWTLKVRERGRGGLGELAIRCANGCSAAEILQVLNRDPADLRVAEAEHRAAEAIAAAELSSTIAVEALELAGATTSLRHLQLARVAA